MKDELPELERRRELMIAYLKDKVAIEDWHGVADAAMDIREIDAVRAILEKWQKNPQSECSPAQGA